MMKMVVLIPSYRRPDDLERCLCALSQQVRAPDQVLVVARLGDDATNSVATAWLTRLPLEVVVVTLPGQVQALNAGLARVRGDIVAITDDDAAPRPDWLARIEAHFAADPKLGGVGGRDWVHQNGVVEMGERSVVGRVHWFGRISGNHHLGAGNARDVDVLKGSNCAFRLAVLQPLGFDACLKGAGAQVHNDMMASLAVKRAGCVK
jgi:cellulose synthase/poly-beta-1,6-N-acetylglucosamine synthase-like glycosyltransferase